MKPLRIGLNGFGRIGRAFTRIASSHKTMNIVAINTTHTKPNMLAYLLQYDSVYHTFNHAVTFSHNAISYNTSDLLCFNEQEPKNIPWEKGNVDIVIDCTGKFKNRVELTAHKHNGVKHVIVSAPTNDESIPTVVLGVNDKNINFKKTDIISNASCTTNCAAPLFSILDTAFGVQSGFLSTVHSYTNSQQILDASAKDFTRARAASLSIIPSTTGAAQSVVRVLPQLKDKIDGMSLRVPTPVGSIVDISCLVTKSTNQEVVNNTLLKASNTTYKNILAYETTELVSSDYIGSPYSCIVDANYTKVINNNFIKVLGWYDNEWGYSSRLVDLVEKFL